MLGGRELKKSLVIITLLISTILVLQLALPVFSAPSSSNEPTGFVGVDFIVSYDDNNAARHPDIAITPTNDVTKGLGIAGTIHTVWDEVNDLTGVSEIHHSMSLDGGLTWSGEKEDVIISDTRAEPKTAADANVSDAINPSIAIDSQGRIHVVWAQMQGDETWEVHYSNSTDNGNSWSAASGNEKMISFYNPETEPGHEMSGPKITAGLIPNKPQDFDTLHVVWSEFNQNENLQEVYYSRSDSAGEAWSGEKQNIPVSQPIPEQGFASDPVIAVSGAEANFVHVSWIQKGNASFDEVYYVRSIDGGTNWNPKEERPLTLDLGDDVNANNLSISSFGSNIHMIWSQIGKDTEIQNVGILYSGSKDDGNTWTSEEQPEEIPINNKADMNIAYNPTLATNKNGEAYAYWTELHNESYEIHLSWNKNPLEGYPWSAQDMTDDEIISNPDKNDAHNVSVAMDLDASMRPQVVWDEPNPDKITSKTGQGILAAQAEHEIHYDPPTTPEWTLSTSVSGSGSIIKDPYQSTYPDGTSVKVTANPSAGWSFTEWGGDLSGSTTNPEYILMDSDKSITAIFTQDQYTLTITTSGNGSVTKSPNQSTYTYGTTVQLTANPDSGWEFDHWDGDLTGTANPDSLTIYRDCSVTAYFVQNIYNVNLTSGWNLVSLPFNQSDTSVASVLSSISGSYDSVKYYDTLDTSDHWKSYRPGGPVNDLNNIDHTMAFWVHTTSACTLSVYGDDEASTAIPLYAGWNFVGYPTLDANKTVSEALTGVSYDIIEGFDIDAPYLLRTLSETDKMTPGAGYWIRVTADTTWTVNW